MRSVINQFWRVGLSLVNQKAIIAGVLALSIGLTSVLASVLAPTWAWTTTRSAKKSTEAAATSAVKARAAKSSRGDQAGTDTYQVSRFIQAVTFQPGKLFVTDGVRVVGADRNAPEVQQILTLLADINKASNRHAMDDVMKYYSHNFVSGDNLPLSDVRAMIQDTWKTYPDIQYASQVLEIRVNGDWATVETQDNARAVAQSNENLMKAQGQLLSQSRGMVYLRRVSKSWEITSDYTLYERACVSFGEVDSLQADVSAPDQVFSGEDYSANLHVALPQGAVAIASIAKDPLLFPQLKPNDKFRSLAQEGETASNLQRVFQANRQNRNEMITVTIGVTNITEDESSRPQVNFKGIATLVKRVNVLPKPSPALDSVADVVKTSASGALDFSEAAKEGSLSQMTTPTATPPALDKPATSAPAKP